MARSRDLSLAVSDVVGLALADALVHVPLARTPGVGDARSGVGTGAASALRVSLTDEQEAAELLSVVIGALVTAALSARGESAFHRDAIEHASRSGRGAEVGSTGFLALGKNLGGADVGVRVPRAVTGGAASIGVGQLVARSLALLSLVVPLAVARTLGARTCILNTRALRALGAVGVRLSGGGRGACGIR